MHAHTSGPESDKMAVTFCMSPAGFVMNVFVIALYSCDMITECSNYQLDECRRSVLSRLWMWRPTTVGRYSYLLLLNKYSKIYVIL